MTRYLDVSRPAPEAGEKRTRYFSGLCRRLVLQRLARLRGVAITLRESGGSTLRLGDDDAPLAATITIRDPRFYRQVLTAGTVGAGEAWIRGYWDCDDLTTLIRAMLRNRDQLERLDSGAARTMSGLYRLLHGLRRNTRAGSRRNIAAHYDLGNDFFEQFLDRSMMYSCAIFDHPGTSLEMAQLNKLDRICRKLDLGPDDHVLEIGTGWGGFAIYAAARYGCRVTTTTISKEQHEYAQQKVHAAGLGNRVTLLLQDYRDLDGEYDKLVSIEMIEAVGADFLDEYLRRIGRLVRRGGSILVQAITIEDHRYRRAVKNVDFIKQFVFPGSFIPSISIILNAAARNTDLTLRDMEDIGSSYALTLREWQRRLNERRNEVAGLGYPDRLIRLWLFYLSYCEGGFMERSISDVQLLFTRPLHWGVE